MATRRRSHRNSPLHLELTTESFINHLLDNWINGNSSYVLNEFTKLPGVIAAYVAIRLYQELSSYGNERSTSGHRHFLNKLGDFAFHKNVSKG